MHADRNFKFQSDLHVHDSEHSLTEIAAIESIFWTLKKLEIFYIPLMIAK